MQTDGRDDDAVAAAGVPEADPGHVEGRRHAAQGGTQETSAEAEQKGNQGGAKMTKMCQNIAILCKLPTV